jgi:hypothetical protein
MHMVATRNILRSDVPDKLKIQIRYPTRSPFPIYFLGKKGKRLVLYHCSSHIVQLGVYPCVATESTYYHTLNFLLMVFKLSSFFKGKREIWMSYLKYAKTKIQILLSGQFQELKSN